MFFDPEEHTITGGLYTNGNRKSDTLSLTLEHILELDHFTAEDRVAIQNAIQSDKELEKALQNWIAVSDHVKRQIETNFPTSETLVAFALRNQNQTALFDSNSGEPSAQISVADSVEAALAVHPSIQHIVDRIQADAVAFSQCWNEALETKDRPAISRPNRVMRLVRWSASVAAIIALVTFGITQFQFESPTDAFGIETVAGEQRTVTLGDGSTVRLSPSSSIAWNGDFSRSLELNGSAFFDVVASAEPFTIDTPQGKTTVLGTSFGMQTLGSGNTLVTLVSGRVGISLAGQNLSEGHILTPGMQGIMSSSEISVQSVNLTDALSWSELIVFRDTPMKEVVDVLSKRFGVKINLPVTLNKTPLTGTFEQDRGVQEILEIVAAALGAKVELDKTSGEYALSR